MTEVCDRVLHLIGRYLDGELPPELEHAVTAHLSRCPKCKAEADLERAVKDSVARSCQEPAPPTLRQAVYQRLVQTRVEWADGTVVEQTLRFELND